MNKSQYQSRKAPESKSTSRMTTSKRCLPYGATWDLPIKKKTRRAKPDTVVCDYINPSSDLHPMEYGPTRCTQSSTEKFPSFDHRISEQIFGTGEFYKHCVRHCEAPTCKLMRQWAEWGETGDWEDDSCICSNLKQKERTKFKMLAHNMEKSVERRETITPDTEVSLDESMALANLDVNTKVKIKTAYIKPYLRVLFREYSKQFSLIELREKPTRVWNYSPYTGVDGSIDYLYADSQTAVFAALLRYFEDSASNGESAIELQQMKSELDSRLALVLIYIFKPICGKMEMEELLSTNDMANDEWELWSEIVDMLLRMLVLRHIRDSHQGKRSDTSEKNQKRQTTVEDKSLKRKHSPARSTRSISSAPRPKPSPMKLSSAPSTKRQRVEKEGVGTSKKQLTSKKENVKPRPVWRM